MHEQRARFRALAIAGLTLPFAVLSLVLFFHNQRMEQLVLADSDQTQSLNDEWERRTGVLSVKHQGPCCADAIIVDSSDSAARSSELRLDSTLLYPSKGTQFYWAGRQETSDGQSWFLKDIPTEPVTVIGLYDHESLRDGLFSRMHVFLSSDSRTEELLALAFQRKSYIFLGLSLLLSVVVVLKAKRYILPKGL